MMKKIRVWIIENKIKILYYTLTISKNMMMFTIHNYKECL